jgi:hypothetical protein
MREKILNEFQALVDRWYYRYSEHWLVNMVRGVYDPARTILPFPGEKADVEQILAEFEELLSRYNRAEAINVIRSMYDPLYREPISELAFSRRFNRIREAHEQGMGTKYVALNREGFEPAQLGHCSGFSRSLVFGCLKTRLKTTSAPQLTSTASEYHGPRIQR